MPERRSEQPGKRRLRRSSFIGRQADLAALEEALARDPLVTVLGPPGIGKTRLAERCFEERDGAAAWLCDLTEATSVDEILRRPEPGARHHARP
ncbi:MAG: AAA family ATPase [Minicystis sp.]